MDPGGKTGANLHKEVKITEENEPQIIRKAKI